MKRIIAIDYGDARTGVAVSDLTGTLAGEALTIQEWNAEKLAQRLAFFARERDAEKFVLGLPKNMDGTEGPRAEKARQFKALLEEASGMPVMPSMSAPSRSSRRISAAVSRRGPCTQAYTPPSASGTPQAAAASSKRRRSPAS